MHRADACNIGLNDLRIIIIFFFGQLKFWLIEFQFVMLFTAEHGIHSLPCSGTNEIIISVIKATKSSY